MAIRSQGKQLHMAIKAQGKQCYVAIKSAVKSRGAVAYGNFIKLNYSGYVTLTQKALYSKHRGGTARLSTTKCTVY